MKLPNLNTVNDLIEKGFVRAQEGHVIALHPMIQEVVIEEAKPSLQKCGILLESMREICLRHGDEIPYYRMLFQTVENVLCSAFKDDQWRISDSWKTFSLIWRNIGIYREWN